jgi:small GTP-binding protein
MPSNFRGPRGCARVTPRAATAASRAARAARMSRAPRARVVAVGDSAVGKTSLLASLMGTPFNAHEPNMVGANWHLFAHEIDGRTVELQVWDTAGQERYRALGPLYYRDAAAGVVVFDITARPSWRSVRRWTDSVLAAAGDPLVFVVGNKADRADERAVTEEEARAWADSNNCEYFETSARTGQGVRALFETIALRLAGSGARVGRAGAAAAPARAGCCQ